MYAIYVYYSIHWGGFGGQWGGIYGSPISRVWALCAPERASDVVLRKDAALPQKTG